MELTIGQVYEYQKVITQEDIVLFAKATGDENPLHLDEEYAKATMFKGRIAHGMLAAGVISAVLGMHFPGPGTVYLGQTLRFKKPVRPGDTLTVRVTVAELTPKAGYTAAELDTVCAVNGETVVTGRASVIPPQ